MPLEAVVLDTKAFRALLAGEHRPLFQDREMTSEDMSPRPTVKSTEYMETTEPQPVVLFYQAGGPLGCFSNFYRHPFDFELPPHAAREGFPRVFRCEFGEKAIMATKAAMMGDHTSFDKILAEDTPLKCKYLGRSVAPFDLDRWKTHLLETATAVCLARFSGSEDLWAVLNATGNAILAEASPGDAVWGIGLGLGDPAALDPTKWCGTNVLGQALMATRKAIREAIRARDLLEPVFSSS
jgi:ribA/ribD-fused uncharacterized protein